MNPVLKTTADSKARAIPIRSFISLNLENGSVSKAIPVTPVKNIKWLREFYLKRMQINHAY